MRAAAVFFLLLALALCVAASPRTTEIYHARHRTAEELAPLAEAVLGEEGGVVLDGNGLLLVGSPDAVQQAIGVLKARDVPLDVVTLHLEVRSATSLRDSGYRIRWGTSEETLRRGTLHGARDNGRTLRTSRQEHTGFSLQVRDGEVGRIDIGRSVPVLARGLWGGATTFGTGRSELTARPRVLQDGRVSLDLSWSRGDVGREGETRFAGGSTTVTITPGETVALGGITQKLDSPAGRSATRPSTRATSDDQVILLRIEVE